MSFKRRVIAGCFLVVVGTATAAEPPGAKAYLEAAAQFNRLAGGKVGDDHVPRLGEPEVAELLNKMSDVHAVFGDGDFGQQDMASLMPVCDKANEAVMRYTFSGSIKLKSQIRNGEPLPGLVPQLAALMTANTLKYQDEIMPLMAFSMHCMGYSLPPLEAFIAGLKPEDVTDVRRSGLQQMRTGVSNMLLGAMRSAIEPAIHSANQRLLMDASADVAQAYAKVLPVAQRATVLEAVKEARGAMPETLRPQLDRVAKAMQSTDCTGLCKY